MDGNTPAQDQLQSKSESDVRANVSSTDGWDGGVTLAVEKTAESFTEWRTALLLNTVCPPVILGFGTLGNILTVLVLATMPGRPGQSMPTFLTALAVSDLLLLYSGLLRRWMVAVFGLDIFVVYTCGMTSAWFLVAMTLQRVVSVLWPHRVVVLCTRRTAQLTLVVIVLLLMALNAHFLVLFTSVTTTDSENNSTVAYCDYNDLASPLAFYDAMIFPWLDLSVTSLTPSALLLAGNCVLGLTVSRAARQARRMTSQGQGQRQRAASSMTLTLMTVSMTYLLLTLPVCAYYIAEPYVSSDAGPGVQAVKELLAAVVNLLWYCNAAVNFYLYILTGTRFRRQCLRLLACGRFGSRAPGEPAITSTPSTVASAISMTTLSGSESKTTVSEVVSGQDDDDF